MLYEVITKTAGRFLWVAGMKSVAPSARGSIVPLVREPLRGVTCKPSIFKLFLAFTTERMVFLFVVTAVENDLVEQFHIVPCHILDHILFGTDADVLTHILVLLGMVYHFNSGISPVFQIFIRTDKAVDLMFKHFVV